MRPIRGFKFLLTWIALICGPLLQAATFTWTGSASSDWFNSANWSPAGVPVSSDTVNFSSGTINLTNSITVSGQFNWSGGTLMGNGITISSGGVMNISGTSWVYLEDPLTNNGTVNWTGTVGIQIYNNSTTILGLVQNLPGGVWNVQCDQPLTVYSGTPFFNNAGSVVKSGTSGTTTISLPFYNTGSVTNLSGTLNFNNGGPIQGTYTVAASRLIEFSGGNFTNLGAVINGPGQVAFNGGILTLPTNVLPNLQMIGGTVILGPSFQGGTITNLSLPGSTLAGTNTVTGTLMCGGNLTGPLQVATGGTFTITNGTASGPLTIASGAVFDITGTGWFYLLNTLTNSGTVNWTATVGIQVYNNNGNIPGMIQNQAGGVWNISCDQPMYIYGGNPFFNNAGSVVKSGTSGTTTIGIPFFNTGTVTNLSGTLTFSGGGPIEGPFTAATPSSIINFSGNFTNANPVLTGPGLFEFSGGNLTLPFNFIPGLVMNGGNIILGPGFQGGTITNLVSMGSVLTGSNTVTGTLICDAGFTGPMVVAPGGTLTLTNGTVSAPLTVAAGGVLNVTGNSWLYLFNALTNAGTVNWSGTVGFEVYSNSTSPGVIQNLPGGVWNILSDQPMYIYSGLASFYNAGTIVKSVTTGTTTIGVPFYNTGTVTNLSGTINFTAGGTIGGIFTAAAGKLIEFNGGNYGVSNPAINGPGVVEFNAGSLTFNTDIVPNLLLTGGNLVLGPLFQGGTITNLTLAGTVLATTNTVTGTLTVTNGTINAPLTVASGGVLNITGNNWFYINNPLTNAGTVNWSGTVGIYMTYSGSQLGQVQNLASGTWNVQCDQPMYVYTGNPFFNNAGNFVKSLTSGTTAINVPFYNTGTVTNLSGTINFGGGGSIGGVYTVSAGAAVNFNGGIFTVGNPVINVPGSVSQIAGTLTFTSGFPANLNLNSGTVLLSPGFEGGSITNLTLSGGTLNGTNTVTGTLNWTGGTLAGPLTIASGGVLNIGGSNPKYLYAGLTNSGTVTWTGSGNINIYNDNSTLHGSIWNLSGGLFNIATDQNMNCACYGGEYIVNQGTWEKTAGTGQTYIGVTFTNTGSVSGLEGSLNFNGGGYISGAYTAASGASVNFTSGNFTGAFPSVGGAGVVAETGGAVTYYTNVPAGLALNGGTVLLAPGFQGGSITNLSISGSSLAGVNTVTGTLNWTAGTLVGPLTIALNGVLNMSGGNGKFIEAGLTNLGTMTWTGSGSIYIYNDNSTYHGSLWNLPGGLFNIATDQNINCACYGHEYIFNQGTLEKTAGAGTTYISVLITNTGSIQGLSGTLNLNGGGNIDGMFAASSGAVVNFNGGNFAVVNPTVTGLGTVAFTGGTMTLLSSHPANLALTGGTLLLGPAFNGGGITNLTLAGSTLAGTNSVTGNMTWSAGTLTGPLTIAGTGSLLLNGSANKFLQAPLTNSGTVTWTGTGNLYVYNNNASYAGAVFNQPGGLFLMENDQNIYCACYGNEHFDNLGTVEKLMASNTTAINIPFTNNGTLNVQGGLVNFNGTVGYVQAGETLNFGITSTNGNNGKFTVPGNINFDGTLGVNFLNGFTPSTNQSFTLVNYASHAGTFSSLSLPALPVGLTWDVDYLNTSLVLRVLPAAATDTLQISGSVTATNGSPIAGATVFAFIGANTFTNLIVNPSFELPPNNGTNYIFYNPGSTNITGWTVTSLGVVDISAGYLGAAEDGNQFFDPTGNPSGTGGGITQTFPTVVGASYKLSFYLGYYSNPGVAALGVTVGSVSNSFIANSSGSGGLNWTPQAIYFTATSNQTTVTFRTLTTYDSNNNFVDNVQVTPPDVGQVLEAVTDGSGHYQIAVGNGTFQVGVSGLPALGYNNVAQQTAVVTSGNQTVNFTASGLSSGQLYTITTSVNPPGAGTSGGDGTFGSGATAVVTATPITSTLPYYFANWTENGVFQSATNVYSFTVIRSRNLVANFTLPLYTIVASNNPANGGVITGAGSYFYGTTNVLIATPNFGFNFTNWTEGAAIVGTTPAFTNIVYTNHVYVANYVAANLFHTVTTATAPPGLAVVAGAGSYTNGQTGTLSAPMFITNTPYFYTFQQFTLSNSVVSTSNTFNKTFSTLDATNLLYVAAYKTMTILPLVTNITVNYVNPVPATTNFLLTLQFDRSMQTNISPLVVLTNSAVATQPVVMTNGYWTSTAGSNDTYHVPPVTFSAGMDGTMQLYVSGAQDANGDAMNLTNPASYTVESTPPPAPVIALVSSNSSSATVSWTGYSAPPTLAGFRIYLANTTYTSLGSLPAYTSLGSAARSYTYYGLLLNTNYYLAVQAVDNAGNALTAVTPLKVYLPSTIPPPVPIQVVASGGTSATISWNSYSTASLLGFTGYNIYYQQSNFASVTGLTPQVSVGAGQTSFQVNGLDRTKTTYFAVVGYNNTNGFNSTVTTASWSDPYAGNIGANTTIGGPGQNVVNIYHSIVVLSNATLTIPAGTTLLFAPGTSLTVQQGALAANGTALAPVIFDSANDVLGQTPAAGDWGGVTLQSGAGGSSLQFVEILFGGGLTINGCSPNVQAFTANNNLYWGLGLTNGASLTTSAALLTGNGVGAQQSDTSSLTVQNSVLQNNNTNAWAAGTAAMNATSNWWGSTVQSNVSATLVGNVNYTPFLTYVPLLTPAIGTSNGLSQVGGGVAVLSLACRTAVSMRLSEDFTFNGVFFSPFTNSDIFGLSAGGGLKHIFAQFRSATGATNYPVELDVNYVTVGPVIQSFTLTDGETLHRPLMVMGSAAATLGMQDLEFYLDGVGLATNIGGNFSFYFDVRNFPNAVHQAMLLARDNSGNIATLEEGVVLNVTPPPAPVITSPPSDYITNNGIISINGTAEPRINVQVTANGAVLGTTVADTNGNFSVTNVTLLEGANNIVASASDSTGITPSAARHITVETIPPVAVILNPPLYTPGVGLSVTWQFAASGKQPTSFQLFWSTTSFTNSSQAPFHSIMLSSMNNTLQALADGTYYFGVVGYDAAGNPSPLSGLVTATYHATPPALNIAYGSSSPVGPGPLSITLSSSESLVSAPSLTLQPYGSPPILLSMTNAALNIWQTTFNVTPSTPSGAVTVQSSAQDPYGNVFNGAPSGPALAIDTTPPAGAIVTVPAGPVQTLNTTNVAVQLTLSKLEQGGLTPTLKFQSPLGDHLTIPLTGAGSNWNGTLTLSNSYGTGFGRFTMSAEDAEGNIGTNITSGAYLELYNTALPPAPAAPTGISGVSLPGGGIRLTWNSVSNAQIYRLYREPGTNFTMPATLDIDNITNAFVTDQPTNDGFYAYAVSASRLGSESGFASALIAISDSTAPPAPTNVVVALAASGVAVSWQQPNGEVPNHYNVYRNGVLINSTTGWGPIVDFPPRGTNTYVVDSVDAIGNQNPSAPAAITLLVSPVSSLTVVVNQNQAVALSWISSDATATGFNVYRNGVLQNGSPLTGTNYTDNLPLSDAVTYAVTAVNASAQSSPPRQVTVCPVALGMQINPPNQRVLVNYFDQYFVGITNRSTLTPLPLSQLVLNRSAAGSSPLVVTQAYVAGIIAGGNAQPTVVVPEPAFVGSQAVQLAVFQQTDSQGSTVVYQNSFTFTNSGLPGVEIALSASQQPLAGGLNTFQAQINNPSAVPIQIITARSNGSKPGDLYISVENNLGQVVSSTPYQGTPSGTVILPDGRAYVQINPGASLSITVSNVLVPEALAGNTNITFAATITNIYCLIGSPLEVSSGPLSGTMIEPSLALPPYNGTAQTDSAVYTNNQSVYITGQALSTSNGLPVPNVPLNIGFATRGYVWFQAVTTDTNGNYAYTFNPPPGFSGTLSIWAANPQVVDQLNQVTISVYRTYCTPAEGAVVMSQNSTATFNVQLINPGNVPLTAFSVGCTAYQVVGTNLTPIGTLTGSSVTPAGFTLAPNQSMTVTLQLAASISAPTNAQAVFTFTSAEGAQATLTADCSLLPAVPVISVVNPPAGYVEVNVNRGDQVSSQVTIQNVGLTTLKGVTIQPPTNITWMSVNLPVSTNGQITLPDLPQGQSNTFTVVFMPPAAQALDQYQDYLLIRATNLNIPYRINLYGRVTSDLTGAVQFQVEDYLGNNIEGASVRLQNNLLQSSAGPFLTDSNGLVTITNLMEGVWNWQASAPGCSPASGTVTITADQTAFENPVLIRSLVTVNFTVVPVPFTDLYEIQVEQTYETFVPVPELVMSPPYTSLKNVSPGFQATINITVQDAGLIKISDVSITGQQTAQATMTPLITYIPELAPQQIVTVPFVVTYSGNNAPGQQALSDCLPGGAGDIAAAFAAGIAALANGQGMCPANAQLIRLVGQAALAFYVFQQIPTSFGDVLGYVASAVGCLIGQLFLGADGGGGGGGAGDGDVREIVAPEGGGCFTPDTPVLMADGTVKPISEVRSFDVVRSGSRVDNRATVENVYMIDADSVAEIVLSGRTGAASVIHATSEHFFWVDGKGWMSVRELRAGDWLFDSADQRVQISSINFKNGKTKVFTLKLSEANSFYADNILVHDLCGSPPGMETAGKEVAR